MRLVNVIITATRRKMGQKIALARRMFAEHDFAVICETVKISHAALYRYVGQKPEEA